MNVLLDECIPKRLTSEFSGHEVRHVTEMGWASIKNGRLLALAEKRFDVFVTVDRNLAFQQHLPRYAIAVLGGRPGPEAPDHLGGWALRRSAPTSVRD